ncbi:UdgX family uracil-DNA binding protein [Aquicoccus sp. SCR17]|nr:UdgX family uracil-DNA binding protein [Carideicomes alvinocaridis]
MYRVDLPLTGTFAAWRDAARGLIGAGVRPEEVAWQRGEGGADLFGAAPPPMAEAPGLTVPKSFLQAAQLVAWHRDPERFARLYAMLHALQTDRRLMEDRGDPRVVRLHAMAKEVGRDKHKMTAFVRFRELEPLSDRRRFAAWFEPSHYIAEPTAPFFAKRFGDMDWSIFTPDLSVHFDGALRFEPGAPRPDLPEDAAEDLWRTYFRSIFNPARLKPAAMQSEMPRKYWKNLPEAGLIPELIATAQTRAQEMAEAAPTLAPARARPVLERVHAAQAEKLEGRDQFAAALEGCRRCGLWENATRPVPGEGPLDARLMVVGEQPGDAEDLSGRPFVGPAGQLFDRVLAEAGIDRATLYVTNAVKHFKFRARGKRRLHESPSRGEIRHCRWWLDVERERVKPRLILAMGGTAVESLTGTREGLLKRRGGIEAAEDGTPLMVTVHPSYILRLPDRVRQQEETARFREDLQRAAQAAA